MVMKNIRGKGKRNGQNNQYPRIIIKERWKQVRNSYLGIHKSQERRISMLEYEKINGDKDQNT